MRTLASLVLLLTACGEPDAPADPVDGTDEATDAATDLPSDTDAPAAIVEGEWPLLDAVRYRVDWTGGAQTDDGWSTPTDLGWTVTISEGYLVQYSHSLVACADVVASVEPSLLEQAWSWVVPTAFAGHTGESDPSITPQPRLEVLIPPTGMTVGTVEVEPTAYCRSHFNVGRVMTPYEEWPEDPDLTGLSIYLRGTVTSPSGITTDLSLDITEAYGKLFELDADALGWTPAQGEGPFTLDLHYTRDFGTLFDGIDFETTTDRDIGRAILASLVEDAVLVATLEPS